MGEVKRLAKRSSTSASFYTARSHLFKLWDSNYLHETTAQLAKFNYHSLIQTHSKPTQAVGTFWLVLPFYRGFEYHGVRLSLQEAVMPWLGTLSRILGCQPDFKLSFRNPGRNLENVLLASCR